MRDLPLADRATIANMSPEYGATCGIFPIDKETLKYLRLTGRTEEQIALVEAYAREQGMFHDEKTPEAEYSELLSLDLATVEPSLAGPKRPQDRVVLSQAGESFCNALPSPDEAESRRQSRAPFPPSPQLQKIAGSRKADAPPPSASKIPTVHEHVPAIRARILCSMAASSSPPSPPALTPPILRCSSAPDCSPRKP